MSYHEFLASKTKTSIPTGFAPCSPLSPHLFPYQRAIVEWAIRRGRAAVFADCGMGKTLMQLAWAEAVSNYTSKPVLVLAPLAVAEQTIAEGERFGIDVRSAFDRLPVGVAVANYEKLHRIDCSAFAGVVLDESSILKSYNGKTRTQIIESFARTPYRLACTATPAPNDHMELGNHSEFLGVMSRGEMLATYFCHDGGETQVWRLKGHAEESFWRWVASWAAVLRKPSDLGFSDDGFTLPPIDVQTHTLASGIVAPGQLFAHEAGGINEQRAARKATLESRVAHVAELVVHEPEQPWLVWCELNAEGNALERAIPDAVQVSGADDDDAKASKMTGFSRGEHRVMVTKPSIAGFGMNWQHCARVAFVGASYSYEQFYQAVRRCWRYGQTRPVVVHVVTTDVESGAARALARKQAQHDEMAGAMVAHMGDAMRGNVLGLERDRDAYSANSGMRIPGWIQEEAS